MCLSFPLSVPPFPSFSPSHTHTCTHTHTSLLFNDSHRQAPNTHIIRFHFSSVTSQKEAASKKQRESQGAARYGGGDRWGVGGRGSYSPGMGDGSGPGEGPWWWGGGEVTVARLSSAGTKRMNCHELHGAERGHSSQSGGQANGCVPG